jgi:hypothetical protein
MIHLSPQLSGKPPDQISPLAGLTEISPGVKIESKPDWEKRAATGKM